MSENNANQKQESGKVKKAFEANMRKLVGLLTGDTYFKPPKATPDELVEAMATLAKEEKEQLIKNVVTEARTLIKKKRDFDKFVHEEKKKLEKKVEGEQKMFNEDAKKLFGLVKDIGLLEKSYYDTIKNATNSLPNAPEETTDDNEEEQDA
jgi:hypothetical protein